jgi:hypothetical protein
MKKWNKPEMITLDVDKTAQSTPGKAVVDFYQTGKDDDGYDFEILKWAASGAEDTRWRAKQEE